MVNQPDAPRIFNPGLAECAAAAVPRAGRDPMRLNWTAVPDDGNAARMPVTTLSDQLFEEALRFIPGGVNSPVRAFRGVGGIPRFMQRAHGALLVDADGNEYVDFVCT